ncbi:transcription factor Tos4, putative [Talaromyces stipitatus ATCC 10500]|uniref:Transcription factor Tos4, putative n=1 Tax=Talaromyces stipitatus (strain ATCC 10500 / CBS 375.48 / QM 6759 / NRRL 1006) TaxID=441959 RepID=B8MIX6_TALSN|nr:transcription factor Tos4, putative [Talaromyces stipitatus ATCC 10500]EED15638.1 transcription factor Tos4, putative [Talaromyces stipitatus ATCC 10500]
MESSPPRATMNGGGPAAGVKRPASLLPAFEPLSSSPALPRPQKRMARDAGDYPTPMPTSSTHIMSSSPPHMSMAQPKLQRSVFPSSTTERAPLSTVPTLMLPESGESLLMGRSSASCHHQLSANRLISRVHVKATYKAAGNPFDRDRVEIVCTGWNGIKLHCQGKTYDLAKGKTFTSDIKDADIMIDVHDARVLVQWPRMERKDSSSTEPGLAWDANSLQQNKSRHDVQQSPIKEPPRLVSPTSPSPLARNRIPLSSPLLSPSRLHSTISIYEDEPLSPTPANGREAKTLTASHMSTFDDSLNDSHNSALNQLSETFEDYSDHDEENDPIVHSFGPFGENLLPRMAQFRAGGSPTRVARPRTQPEPLRSVHSLQQPAAVKREEAQEKRKEKEEEAEQKPKIDERRAAAIAAIQNHAANQLAFSRLSSTPLSTILQNLPASLWKAEANAAESFTHHEVRVILEDTKCIGEVIREGKDAAGKPLESEFYYIPDFDEDEMRRQAVVNDLRKPGLRNCRKQHKQYYWRKPK